MLCFGETYVKIINAKARKGNNNCCPRSASVQPPTAAVAARKQSADACASIVPAATGRRPDYNRLAARGQRRHRVRRLRSIHPWAEALRGSGACDRFSRGVRRRRAAAPATTAPEGKTPHRGGRPIGQHHPWAAPPLQVGARKKIVLPL